MSIQYITSYPTQTSGTKTLLTILRQWQKRIIAQTSKS